MLQQPTAVDHFFHQVQRQIEILAGGFKTNPRILAREREELVGQTDFGLQTALEFNPLALLISGDLADLALAGIQMLIRELLPRWFGLLPRVSTDAETHALLGELRCP